MPKKKFKLEFTVQGTKTGACMAILLNLVNHLIDRIASRRPVVVIVPSDL